MSILKAELAMLTIQRVGNKLDDALEAARGEISRTKGVLDGLRQASKTLNAVQNAVQSDEQAGKLPKELADTASVWLGKYALGLDMNLARAEKSILIASGVADGLVKAVEVAKMEYDEQRRKIEVVVDREESTPDLTAKQKAIVEESGANAE